MHGVACILGFLPLMGTGAEVLFPIDFCLANLESPAYGALALLWIVAAAAAIVAAACCLTPHEGPWWRRGCSTCGKEPAGAAKVLLRVVAIYFVIAWLNTAIIVLSGLASGPIAGTSAAGLYSTMAIFLHTNQLVVPILFGWALRALMTSALADAGSATGVKIAPKGSGGSSEVQVISKA